MSVTVIDASRGHGLLDRRELWRYRELLWFLVWRDLKVRYKQSVVGVAWAVLKPLATMALFTAIFGHLVHVRTDGTPYAPFVLVGLLAWQLHSHALTESSTSLTLNSRLLTKIYFPRLLIPAASVLAGLAEFAVAGLVLACFLAAYGSVPPARVALLPLFVVMLLAAALGCALWLSALNVQFRDVAYAIPFLTQFWFFATPIVYAAGIVPGAWGVALGANPLAGVVTGLRWCLFPGAPLPSDLLLASVASTAVLLVGGLAYFRRVEDVFADVV